MNPLARPGPRWFNIPAHRSFVDDLAGGLLEMLAEGGPEALSDATVLLPSRRGARALAEAFLAASGGKALLLPQIRALGDLDEGEPPFEPGDLALDLPPAISPLRRRFELAGLVAQHQEALGRSIDATSALELADALGAFFDSLHIEEVRDLDRIDDLAPEALARHWQVSADFLKIATVAWPARLAALGLVDVAQRRVALLDRLAESWREQPPAGVMVAAGSTGSVPSTARLLTVIAGLPQGCVVLPGLDDGLSDAAWDQVADQHPQSALKRLLTTAGIGRDAVAPWRGPDADARGRWRRRVINEALRPAEATADWRAQIAKLRDEAIGEEADPIAQGLEGLSVISARSDTEAADVIALMLREALEAEGRTAALVTPDQALARRVSARLARWAVGVDSSAGQDLANAPAAVLANLLALTASQVGPNPVGLLAILKQPQVRMGLSPEALARAAVDLERFGLRGPRTHDWDQLTRRLQDAKGLTQPSAAIELAGSLRAALAQSQTAYTGGLASPGEAARALVEAMQTLAADEAGDIGALWAGAAGEALGGLLAGLINESEGLPAVTPAQFAELLSGLISRETVRTGAGTHSRLRILGALEARLVRADLLIVGGLEEGVWPQAPKIDPFLSRPMRKALGLPSPERRLGLSAHDFAQAACAPQVVLVHAERRDESPAVMSRWLWRLETLAKGAGFKTLPSHPEPLAWARALDAPPAYRPAKRPKPTPPLAVRPIELPVTGVEQWVRDPYATYARRILGLRPMEVPDATPDARQRGTAVHAAFEAFARDQQQLGDGAAEIFEALLVRMLIEAGTPRARMTREIALAANVSRWVVAFERRRRAGARLVVEQQGRLSFEVGGREFTVTAKADRIEVRAHAADILDFKTGAAPSEKQIVAGLAPQLTLTAAILHAGGFAEAGVIAPGDLVYVRVSGGRIPGEELVRARAGESLILAQSALDGLRRRVERFNDEATPYVSWAMPQFIGRYGGDYDHLARLWEWHVIGEGEEAGGMSDPQIRASDPAASVFVMANAGSGKTSTLVRRVARLLLRGAAPDAILCVTYTKAAAAEMQRRLFQMLGEWAVMEDAKLAKALAELEERTDDLSNARALFARALETPGGLKIQTIHAFCEKLLKRFPLEAGVSPGFTVLEDAAAQAVSARARDDVALAAADDPTGPIGAAYAYLSVQLDYGRFNDMFQAFEAKRHAIAAYVEACADGAAADIWRRCGFEAPDSAEAIAQAAMDAVDWRGWGPAAEALLGGSVTDQAVGALMKPLDAGADFEALLPVFCTQAGKPRARMGTNAIDANVRAWLAAEQTRFLDARERLKAARTAEETTHVLTLALAYIALYEAAKRAHGGLDFGDLIQKVRELLTVQADAAWVLYKLDGGIDHILLDEAQDTAPDQWDILRTLTAEFFAAEGERRRTAFAVGDEKQSIYSFQGAQPERFAAEAREYKAMVDGAGETFHAVPLLTSYRSTPEVLSFVDAVFRPAAAQAGLRPGAAFGSEPVRHLAWRTARGGVDLWPLIESAPPEDQDPWAPVDYEAPESANKQLARKIARAVREMIDRAEARPGEVLILVRRRNPLFHEIIRALKSAGVPVGGADRLKLFEHIVFQDLMALARFCLFPGDDLTLAALLRSPFCDIDEGGLYDLAQGRGGSLWAELTRRSGEREAWGRALDFLGWAKGESARRAPFDFFGRVLTRLDETGVAMRQRMLVRFGREAEDALDAFMGEVLKAEQRGLRDLESLTAGLAQSDIEVKREQEAKDGDAEGEVRVMTVHGAKGLEAPIVILPDTTTKATAQGGALLETGDGGFLWAPRKADDCPASAEARARRDADGAAESLRLLYVALTRARERLILCGVQTRKSSFEGSWRDLCDQALHDPEIAPDLRTVDGPEGLQIIRFGADPVSRPLTASPGPAAPPLPAWARRLAEPEIAAARYASPSTLTESDKGPAPSPLAAAGGLGRYRRGELIHRLLQLLPDIAPLDRTNGALALLARERDLTPEQRTEMAQAALTVLSDERFSAVFGPGSRAEVALAGAAADLPAGLAISGRMDRLVVEADRVLVVDYKTNRPSPERIEDADQAYLMQMAVYAAILRQVFPGRRIEAALVWTDGPKLMPIPENLLISTLAGLPRGVDRVGAAP